MSDAPTIAQHYHARTKYDPQTLQAHSQPLDWAQQPVPFKDYKIGTTFDLKPFLDPDNPDVAWWQRLSQLLFCSYGLTGRIVTPTGPHFLRAAPSAGGLYPAELYLISRGSPRLPAGLYNYQARSHALVHFWETDSWTKLQAACCWHPSLEQTQLAVVLTGVFWRSAWRYQARAYRRICLDSGHLLGNIELASALSDYRPHLIGTFADDAINQLLYLDAEQEGALTVIALADLLEIKQNLPLARPAIATTAAQPHTTPVGDRELLSYLHRATQLPFDPALKLAWKPVTPAARPDKYNFPFCLKVDTTTDPIDWGPQQIDLRTVMLKRRSTRAYSGDGITLAELKAMLDFTYQPQHYPDQGLDGTPDYFDLSLVETFVVVSQVAGLEEGCYYYAPTAQELRQIRFKNFRTELHYLCLGQELGRDAAAVVFHTADLQAACEAYGDRVYRYLHLDAGHLGQRLNLAALQLGLGVSGIGGFFDDQVNDVLGIPPDEAVLYITTLGQPA